MRLLILVAVLVSASACAQTGEKPSASEGDDRARRADSVVTSAPDVAGSEETVDLVAGETPVALVIRTFGDSGADRVNFLNVHDNESTSVEAALDVARERGGRVVEMVHTGERHLRFEVGGETYEADPNRMFTDAGRGRTLARESRDTEAARTALAAFAEAVLDVYSRAPTAVVVALHNNTDENYSAASYLPGAVYESDAEAVTVHDGTDPDDFFFVTDRGLYDALVAEGFNAVLQDNEAATDDGSLSVWAAREGVPYVNVEAQHGHRAEQARMIEALMDVLAAP
ncbi:MAG: hypothetical protein AAF845_20090 [Bacteroidota bacterium]